MLRSGVRCNRLCAENVFRVVEQLCGEEGHYLRDQGFLWRLVLQREASGAHASRLTGPLQLGRCINTFKGGP